MRLPCPNPVRLGWLIFPAFLAAWLLVLLCPSRQTSAAAASGEVGQRRPVLVELFTSEGCSSCPPADTLLARLDAQQFVAGAQAIVLSEHVTYWNHLGWRDPFSLDAVTERQQQYAARFGLDGPYTPQAVVDGEAELVGSDQAALTRAVTQAAASPGMSLSIQDAAWSGESVHFTVDAGADSAAQLSRSTLMAVLAEDSTQSSVARGENAGRTLRHVAVLRVLQEMGKGALDGRALVLKVPGASQAGQGGSLRLVVFLTDRRSGHGLGAAEQTLSR